MACPPPSLPPAPRCSYTDSPSNILPDRVEYYPPDAGSGQSQGTYQAFYSFALSPAWFTPQFVTYRFFFCL